MKAGLFLKSAPNITCRNINLHAGNMKDERAGHKNQTDSKKSNDQHPASVIPVDTVIIEADKPPQWKMAENLR